MGSWELITSQLPTSNSQLGFPLSAKPALAHQQYHQARERDREEGGRELGRRRGELAQAQPGREEPCDRRFHHARGENPLALRPVTALLSLAAARSPVGPSLGRLSVPGPGGCLAGRRTGDPARYGPPIGRR